MTPNDQNYVNRVMFDIDREVHRMFAPVLALFGLVAMGMIAISAAAVLQPIEPECPAYLRTEGEYCVVPGSAPDAGG
jgi:hypothetical protein